MDTSLPESTVTCHLVAGHQRSSDLCSVAIAQLQSSWQISRSWVGQQPIFCRPCAYLCCPISCTLLYSPQCCKFAQNKVDLSDCFGQESHAKRDSWPKPYCATACYGIPGEQWQVSVVHTCDLWYMDSSVAWHCSVAWTGCCVFEPALFIDKSSLLPTQSSANCYM